MTTEQAMQIAMQHHQAGRLAEAEKIYGQILAQVPDHARAAYYLGALAAQAGGTEQAVELIRRAIAINPNFAEAHCNLGALLRGMGRLDEAIAACRRAIQLKPNYAEACNNLGVALEDQGQLDEAIVAYNRAIQFKPDYAEAHNNLGNALRKKGQFNEAIAAYNRAIQLKPDYAEALNSMGGALQRSGRRDEAIAAYTRAIQLKPDHAEAHNNLGCTLMEMGQLDKAIAACRRATLLKPDYAVAHNNLGIALGDMGRLDEAIAAFDRTIGLEPNYAKAYTNLGVVWTMKGNVEKAIAAHKRAIQLKPDLAEAHNNLGNALKDMGRLPDAIASYRRACELKPDYSESHSNLVYMLHFSAEHGPAEIVAEHRVWVQRHAAPLAGQIRPHENTRDPDRRLRLGYISPYFRDHVVGLNLMPVLQHHDHQRFEIFCYSNVLKTDSLTGEFRAHADQWRDIVRLGNEQVAQMIRQDGIDILVDLALHMAGNRMLVMARKPAPVQVAHMGYPASTGLPTIDYRITDPYLDPPGCDPRGPEEPVRLPHTFWCYRPESSGPAVNALPALSRGHVTFGSLNNLCKISPMAIALWSRVLRAVANSRMMALAPDDSGARGYLLEQFAGHGIAADRLEWVERRNRNAYLATYHQIDIGLDPLPYTGHTTSCDSFWMGVPVVTLPGSSSVSRGGVSLASNLNLPELIAATPEDYVKISTELAGDLPRLSNLRGQLRQRMKDSPLMDEVGYTRDLETAYRRMWIRWAKARP